MKIRVKNIKGEIFIVDADASDTIGQLKDIICLNRAEYTSQAPNMRLIYNGVILEVNSALIGKYELKDTDFLVCMVKKANAVAVSSAGPAEKKAHATTTADVTADATVASPFSVASPPVAAASTSAATSTARSESISNLMAMTGLPDAVCVQALEAANNDPNLAFDFLTGYAAPATRPRPASRSVPTTPSPLDRIRTHPQFESLKELIRQNPAAIIQVKAIIQQSDPELSAAIHANPGQFEAIMMTSNGNASPVMPPLPPGGHAHNFVLAEGGDGDGDDADDEDYVDGDDDGQDAAMTDAELDELAGQMGITREELIGAIGEGIEEELTQEDENAIQDIMDQTNCTREDVIDCYLDCGRDVDQTIDTLMIEMMDGDGVNDDFEGYDES